MRAMREYVESMNVGLEVSPLVCERLELALASITRPSRNQSLRCCNWLLFVAWRFDCGDHRWRFRWFGQRARKLEEAARIEQLRWDVEDGEVSFLVLSLLLFSIVGGCGGCGGGGGISRVVRHCRQRRFEFLILSKGYGSGLWIGSWPGPSRSILLLIK